MLASPCWRDGPRSASRGTEQSLLNNIHTARIAPTARHCHVMLHHATQQSAGSTEGSLALLTHWTRHLCMQTSRLVYFMLEHDCSFYLQSSFHARDQSNHQHFSNSNGSEDWSTSKKKSDQNDPIINIVLFLHIDIDFCINWIPLQQKQYLQNFANNKLFLWNLSTLGWSLNMHWQILI